MTDTHSRQDDDLRPLVEALDAGLAMLADPDATQLDAEQVSILFDYAISRLRGEVQ